VKEANGCEYSVEQSEKQHRQPQAPRQMKLAGEEADRIYIAGRQLSMSRHDRILLRKTWPRWRGWDKGAGQSAPQIDGAGILELLISGIGFSRAFSLERQATPVKGSDAPLLIDTHSSWP